MHAHNLPARKVLADYNTVEWNGIRVRVRPTGFREWKIPIVGRVLRKWPFFTGAQPWFEVEAKYMRGDWQNGQGSVTSEFYDADGGGYQLGSEQFSSLLTPLHSKVQTGWLTNPGQHKLKVKLQAMSESSANMNMTEDLVIFDVKSSDTLFLLIAGIAASAIVAAASSVCGGIVVGKFLEDDSPQRVVIVDEMSPASQSKRDGSEQ